MTKNLRSLLITVTLLAGMFPGVALHGMEPEEAENGHNVRGLETADAEIMDKIGGYLTWRDISKLHRVSKGMRAKLLSAGIYKPIYLVGSTQSLRRKLEKIKDQDWLKGDIRLRVTNHNTNDINEFINWLAQNNNLSGRITALNLSFNQLQVLPETIGNLINLQMLNLFYNQLQVLPETIGNLVNLRELELSWNQLQVLPETICNLVNLRELNLGKNQNLFQQEFPAVIFSFENLQKLDLSRNQLHELPEAIGNLNNLQVLDLFNNPLQEEQRNAIRQMLPHAQIYS